MLLLVDKTKARFYVNIVVFNTSLYTRIIGYKGILRQRFFISHNQGIAGCMLHDTFSHHIQVATYNSVVYPFC